MIIFERELIKFIHTKSFFGEHKSFRRVALRQHYRFCTTLAQNTGNNRLVKRTIGRNEHRADETNILTYSMCGHWFVRWCRWCFVFRCSPMNGRWRRWPEIAVLICCCSLLTKFYCILTEETAKKVDVILLNSTQTAFEQWIDLYEWIFVIGYALSLRWAQNTMTCVIRVTTMDMRFAIGTETKKKQRSKQKTNEERRRAKQKTCRETCAWRSSWIDYFANFELGE